MQSGSTAINTVRIYNPIKQGQDHDLNGEFIRTWVPELYLVPDVYVHEPWKLSMAAQRKAGLRLGFDYPLPIVEPVVAAKEAKQRIWAIRERSGFSAIANEIQQRHGSRRSGLPSTGQRRRRSRRDPVSSDSLQLTLNLS
jgi:deoxyribodipyrimidine photo-lyase